MAKYPSYPYDFTLTANGTVYGFMLAVGEGGKQLSIGEVPGPQTSRVRTDLQASYFDFDPRYDTPFVMSDWSGGLGQLDYDQGLPNRYLWGDGVVTHVGGMAYLRPYTSAEHRPSTSYDLATWNTHAYRRWIKYVTTSGDDRYFVMAGPRIYGADFPTNLGNPSSSPLYVHQRTDSIESMVTFNGAIYFTDMGTAQRIYKVASPTLGTWSVSNISTTTIPTYGPIHLCVVGDTMFAGGNEGLATYNKIYFTTDPDANSWAGPIVVGDESSRIQSLQSVNNFLFVVKEDAIYSVDADQNAIEVVWQWNQRPSDNNFSVVSSYKGVLIFNVENEVFTYDPVTGRIGDLGVSKLDAMSISSIKGLGGDSTYAYVLAKVSVNAAEGLDDQWRVLRGYETEDGWAWETAHTPLPDANRDYLAMEVLPSSPSYANSTALFLIDASGYMDTVILDGAWNTSEQTSINYALSGKLYTSITRDNFPGLQKRRLYLSMVTDQCEAGGVFPRTIAAAYSIDNGATFTDLGTASSDGLHTFAFSDAHSDTILLRFTFLSDFATSPRLFEFDLHSRPRFRFLPTVGATARVASNLERNNQTRDSRSMADIVANLEYLRTYDGEITYADYLGHQFPVSVDSLEFAPSTHREPDGTRMRDEQQATILMARADEGA